MSFEKTVTEQQRLVILQTLAADNDYSLNEYLVADALAQWGHRVSADKVRTELNWLQEQGLVKTHLLAGQALIATLTHRGLDVANGAVRVPGVYRPLPGE